MKSTTEVSKISKRIIQMIVDGLRGDIPEGDIVAIVNTEILKYAKKQVSKEWEANMKHCDASKKQAMLKGVDYVACAFHGNYDGENEYAKTLYVKIMKEAREAINELE